MEKEMATKRTPVKKSAAVVKASTVAKAEAAKIAEKSRIRKEVLDELIQKRGELEAAQNMLKGVILGQGFIVVNDAGLALSYEIDGDKRAQAVRLAGGAHRATRFTEQDANRLATATIDGHGNCGRAIHVTRAIREEMGRLDAVMTMIATA
jgi:hypothetical protein